MVSHWSVCSTFPLATALTESMCYHLRATEFSALELVGPSEKAELHREINCGRTKNIAVAKVRTAVFVFVRTATSFLSSLYARVVVFLRTKGHTGELIGMPLFIQ